MKYNDIVNQIKKKKSYLCIGLDTDLEKIPTFLLKEEYPLFEFNKRIIDATHASCIAYKPNLAFYETLGSIGWVNFELSVAYIKENYPDIFIIADAKRGDIGNTSSMYAKAFLKEAQCDAVTVAPYMGEDSVKPFLQFPEKWVILLALTSNPGAFDFQTMIDEHSKQMLYEKVINTSKNWGSIENTMYVTGATKAEYLKNIRNLIPNHFLLVPGVGKQGGSLEEVAENGMNQNCGLIVNSSREIIYASNKMDFDMIAKEKAEELQQFMEKTLQQHQII